VVVAMALGVVFLGEELTAVTLVGSVLTFAGVGAVLVDRGRPRERRLAT
jgi:drug/metabolite transporter (DMT)-like permease